MRRETRLNESRVAGRNLPSVSEWVRDANRGPVGFALPCLASEIFGVASPRGRWSALRSAKTANQQKSVTRNSDYHLESWCAAHGCREFYEENRALPRCLLMLAYDASITTSSLIGPALLFQRRRECVQGQRPQQVAAHAALDFRQAIGRCRNPFETC